MFIITTTTIRTITKPRLFLLLNHHRLNHSGDHIRSSTIQPHIRLSVTHTDPDTLTLRSTLRS